MSEEMINEKRNVRLEKVTLMNFGEITDLEPFEAQYGEYPDAMRCIALAYIHNNNGRYAVPFGIYDGDTPIGFLMIYYNGFFPEAGQEWMSFLANNYSIASIMIDKRYQRKGYGRVAIKLALDYIRSFPYGKAEYCWVSYYPENDAARNLFSPFGFIEDLDLPRAICYLKL